MVTIEEAKRTDFDDYYKIRCDKSDIYWMGYEAPPQYESLKKVFYSRIVESNFSNIGDKRIYMIKYTKRKMIVGFIQLSLTLDGVEIGYSIMEQYQGKGIGTQALALAVEIALKISECVYLEIWEKNRASCIIAQRNGFLPKEKLEIKNACTGKYQIYRKYWYTNGK